MHPVVLNGVIAVDGFGEPTSNIDQVVEGYGRDASLGNGDGGTQQPGIGIRVIGLNLEARQAFHTESPNELTAWHAHKVTQGETKQQTEST